MDGNDVEAVLQAATEAVATIRKTGKPYLLETYTYRTRGHFEPDDQSYVDAGELARWKARDPIALLKQRLLERQVVTQTELDTMDARVLEKIEQAAAFANGSSFPAATEVATDVYA